MARPARYLLQYLIASALLASCTGAPATQPDASAERPAAAPRSAACMAHDTTPAIVETVTEDILRRPAVIAPDGTIAQPAEFETRTHQKIVQERRDVTFETPCPPVFDLEFIASLQRALKARGYYKGPVSGKLDAPTSRAIRSYQRTFGLNSSILASDAARRLGLIATPVP